MYVHQALAHFRTRAAIVKALGGVRHRSAVYQWPETGLVPMVPALILARQSGGALRVDLNLYEKHHKKRNIQLADAREDAKTAARIARLRPLR